MYEHYFGLSGSPFPAHASAERFYGTPPSLRAIEILSRVAVRGEGPCLLLGPPGVGKTAVLASLEQNLRDQFQTVRLDQNRVCTRRAFLQQLLYELDLPYQATDEGLLRIALADFLNSIERCPRGVVLLVDDADAMPEKLFDELLMLCNIARSGAALVHLVLAGGVQLEEIFSSPRMAAFQQRLAARVYLECLNRTETEDYVKHLFSVVGGDPQVFTPEALRAIRDESGRAARHQPVGESIVAASDAATSPSRHRR